ncbi:hypothetical protein BpHYR1_004286, partial [Brachionus plicatilis]
SCQINIESGAFNSLDNFLETIFCISTKDLIACENFYQPKLQFSFRIPEKIEEYAKIVAKLKIL